MKNETNNVVDKICNNMMTITNLPVLSAKGAVTAIPSGTGVNRCPCHITNMQKCSKIDSNNGYSKCVQDSYVNKRKSRLLTSRSQNSKQESAEKGQELCFKVAPVDEKLSKIFISIGIPAHVIGYHYLREAVKLAAGNFEMVNCITTKLYPKVATRFSTDTCKVERGIRNAIELAWNKGKIVNLNAIFGIAVCDDNYKPSSGELIALLAEKIYLDGI